MNKDDFINRCAEIINISLFTLSQLSPVCTWNRLSGYNPTCKKESSDSHQYKSSCVWNKCFRNVNCLFVWFLWRCGPTRAMASSFLRFLDYTQRRITVGRTPLDEWSARRRDLYLTTQNTHNRQTSMTPVGFGPTISAGERPQTYALDRAATGTGFRNVNTFCI